MPFKMKNIKTFEITKVYQKVHLLYFMGFFSYNYQQKLLRFLAIFVDLLTWKGILIYKLYTYPRTAT